MKPVGCNRLILGTIRVITPKNYSMDHCYIRYFQILDISSCQVDHLYHDSLLKLPALLILNISNNQLIRTDVEVLETLVHLQRIDLKRRVLKKKKRIQNCILLKAVAQWLRCCATNRKVAGSIPDGVIGIFHWHNPSSRTMALGSIQPPTEMSTRRISWG